MHYVGHLLSLLPLPGHPAKLETCRDKSSDALIIDVQADSLKRCCTSCQQQQIACSKLVLLNFVAVSVQSC